MQYFFVVAVKEAYDYQGRSWTHPPQDVGVSLKADSIPEKCFIPKRLIHTWSGHTKALSAIRWFPVSAHLLLSCSMDSKIKVSPPATWVCCIINFQVIGIWSILAKTFVSTLYVFGKDAMM